MSGCSNDIPLVSFCDEPCTWTWRNPQQLDESFGFVLGKIFAAGKSRKILKLIYKQYRIISISTSETGWFDESGEFFDSRTQITGAAYKIRIEYMHPDVTDSKIISHKRELKFHKIFIKCF